MDGDTFQDVAIMPDGQYAYVTNSNTLFGSVSVIATAKNTAHTGNTVVGRPIKVDGTPTSIAVTPDGQYVYVANYGGVVNVIGMGRNTAYPPHTVMDDAIEISSDPTPVALIGIAITPDGQYAYVSNTQNDTVSVIATAENRTHAPDTVVGHPVVVGKDPVDLAITPDGQYVYVISERDRTVRMIATARNRTHRPGTVINAPFQIESDLSGIAITPDGQHAYIACSCSGIGVGNTVNMVALHKRASGVIAPCSKDVPVPMYLYSPRIQGDTAR